MADLYSASSAESPQGSITVGIGAVVSIYRGANIQSAESAFHLRFRSFLKQVLYRDVSEADDLAVVVEPRFRLANLNYTDTDSVRGQLYTHFQVVSDAAGSDLPGTTPWYPTAADVFPQSENPNVVPPCETGPGSLRPTEGLIYPRRI